MTGPGSPIIVVEDDADMNLALQRLLRAAGYQTETYFSAEEMLAATAESIGACLILDVHLSGISGLELSRRLRRDGIETPLIFMTAYDENDYHRYMKEVKAIAWISKPFPGEQLLAAIREALA